MDMDVWMQFYTNHHKHYCFLLPSHLSEKIKLRLKIKLLKKLHFSPVKPKVCCMLH